MGVQWGTVVSPDTVAEPNRAKGERFATCWRSIANRRSLRRTLVTASIVGTILFLINHLDAVVRGQATGATWAETAASYVIPFCVANVGIFIATWTLIAPTQQRLEPAVGLGTWGHPSEWPRVITHPPRLVRTALTALVVGSIYFLVNQLDNVLAGRASASVWAATGLTYLVPFTVANIGVLIATRRPKGVAATEPTVIS